MFKSASKRALLQLIKRESTKKQCPLIKLLPFFFILLLQSATFVIVGLHVSRFYMEFAFFVSLSWFFSFSEAFAVSHNEHSSSGLPGHQRVANAFKPQTTGYAGLEEKILLQTEFKEKSKEEKKEKTREWKMRGEFKMDSGYIQATTTTECRAADKEKRFSIRRNVGKICLDGCTLVTQ